MTPNWKEGDDERRECQKYCPVPDEVNNLRTEIAVIKNTLITISNNLHTDNDYKKQVGLVFIGLFLSIVAQIVIFAFLFGGLANQVKTNSETLTSMIYLVNRNIYKIEGMKDFSGNKGNL